MSAGDALPSTLPHLLRVLVVVVLVGVPFVAGVVAYWPRRDDREPPARRHARPSAGKRADKRLSSPDPDKPPNQPRELAQPDTGPVASPRKLPGQDRLTRDLRTGMDVPPDWAADHLSGGGSPFQRPDPTLAQQEPPPLRRIDSPPSTAQMPAVLPPLPPIRPRTGPAAATSPHQRPAPAQPRETRQQRRERMERLALDEAARLRREQPPESP